MEYTKERVREILFGMAEPELAKFSGSLLGEEAKAETRLLGVRLPRLRQLAKEIAKADGIGYLDDFLAEYTDENGSIKAAAFEGGIVYMEDIMLYGMVVGCLKEKLETLFFYIKKYVSWITNWSLCDSFCSGLKQTKKQMPEMWEFLQPYLASDKEYEIRFGVVMLMDFYVLPEYIDRLLQIADGIRHEGYYVRMGVAWLLSVCLVKEWEKSFAYMGSPDNHLDDVTYAKTVRKCRESYRLTKEQKESLMDLKRQREGK